MALEKLPWPPLRTAWHAFWREYLVLSCIIGAGEYLYNALLFRISHAFSVLTVMTL